MKTKSYKSLKSGTDIRGVAVQTESSDVTLTIDAIYDLTHAFLKWLADKTGKSVLTVAVGHDVRISCNAIYSAIQKVFVESGCNLVYYGLMSTPAMFMLLKESNDSCDASIMITASHLPYDKNGLKFITPAGGLTGHDLDEIIELAENSEKLPRRLGTCNESSYIDDYCRKLVNLVRTETGKAAPLFGKRIIVDASNGVGGFFVKKVLLQLGAITDGSINLAPDGNFPAHAPNPEAPEAIKALQEAVLASKAELGIIFDTDMDRAAVVDGDGKLINRDALIALVSATILEQKPATIVTDSVTTDGLTHFIERLGGRHVRYKRGYKNVIEEAKRINTHGGYCPLAIETSGHAAYAENYYLDDGAYLVCKIIITYCLQAQKRQKLSDLISAYIPPKEEAEVRIKFNSLSRNFHRESERIIAELRYFIENDNRLSECKNNHDGIRINFVEGSGGGWALIRESVHDPVLPVNFASNEYGGVKLMAKNLFCILEKYPFIDVSGLKSLINNR